MDGVGPICMAADVIRNPHVRQISKHRCSLTYNVGFLDPLECTFRCPNEWSFRFRGKPWPKVCRYLKLDGVRLWKFQRVFFNRHSRLCRRRLENHQLRRIFAAGCRRLKNHLFSIATYVRKEFLNFLFDAEAPEFYRKTGLVPTLGCNDWHDIAKIDARDAGVPSARIDFALNYFAPAVLLTIIQREDSNFHSLGASLGSLLPPMNFVFLDESAKIAANKAFFVAEFHIRQSRRRAGGPIIDRARAHF